MRQLPQLSPHTRSCVTLQVTRTVEGKKLCSTQGYTFCRTRASLCHMSPVCTCQWCPSHFIVTHVWHLVDNDRVVYWGTHGCVLELVNYQWHMLLVMGSWLTTFGWQQILRYMVDNSHWDTWLTTSTTTRGWQHPLWHVVDDSYWSSLGGAQWPSAWLESSTVIHRDWGFESAEIKKIWAISFTLHYLCLLDASVPFFWHQGK